MKALATICSRHKRKDSTSLPAQERYTGEHIQKVANIAGDSHLPFFILSGKYGLIAANKKILHYDYYLEDERVQVLAERIECQLKEAGITELDFYIENKESWMPYVAAVKKGAGLATITLHIRTL